MPESGGLAGYALGAALGAILWNAIFLGLSAVGLLTPDQTWMAIKIFYGGALLWVLAGIIAP